MAPAATLEFQEGRSSLSFDGADAFNSIYRHRTVPALAKVLPKAMRYVSNTHVHESSEASVHHGRTPT